MRFFCNFELLSYGNPRYTCKVRRMYYLPQSPETWSIEIIGSHERYKSNIDVTVLEIISRPLKSFPGLLHTVFPRLTTLTITGCGIKKISKEHLIGLERLKELDLHDNNLVFLQDDLLADKKELKTIRFSDNKIERLSSKLLEPVEGSLWYADFRGNTNIDDYYDKQDHQCSLQRLKDVMDSLQPPGQF